MIMQSGRTIIVDFDGDIHGFLQAAEAPGVIPDGPVDQTVSKLRNLKEMGYRIEVVTPRILYADGNRAVREYLKKHDVPYDDILPDWNMGGFRAADCS